MKDTICCEEYGQAAVTNLLTNMADSKTKAYLHIAIYIKKLEKYNILIETTGQSYEERNSPITSSMEAPFPHVR